MITSQVLYQLSYAGIISNNIHAERKIATVEGEKACSFVPAGAGPSRGVPAGAGPSRIVPAGAGPSRGVNLHLCFVK